MFDYKKILVVGCPGSGKSTFSKKLHKATGIELFHLDALYWNKDCSHISRQELISKQREIFKKESYIIDGNFRNTLELRILHSEAVFFFDLPAEICIQGAKNRKGNRPEMPCELPANDELVDFIKNFNCDVKPVMLELFKKHSANVITFHSRREADAYIEKIKHIDLTLSTGYGVFNHRVAAVIMRNSKLLAQKNIKTGEYYLVGGRIRFGESSAQALVREVNEELGVTVKDFKPLWVNECFFIDGGKRFHEIGMYYLVNLENTKFHHYETVFETQEANRINTYEWLEIEKLNDIVLYPQFIKEEMKDISTNLKLIITKEAVF